MKKIYIAVITILFVSLGLNYSCTNKTKSEEKEQSVENAFDMNNLDSSYAACEDFEKFAVGNWLKHNPVPESESKWGNFNILAERNRKVLREIVEEASNTKSEKGSSIQQVGDFYKAALDTVTIEQLGYTPIKPFLTQIDTISSYQGLLETAARLRKKGSGTFFWYYVDQDAKNTSRYILNFTQGGTGLRNKSYYFPENEEDKAVLEKYEKYITTLFTLTDHKDTEAQQMAKSVVELETAMKKVSLNNVELRDRTKTYNKISLVDLKKMCTSIDWDAFFDAAEVKNIDELNIRSLIFFENFDKTLHKFSVEDWKNYMKWHLINDFSAQLSAPFEKENFSFYYTTLRGVPTQKPRWKRALEGINGYLGQNLGKIYVEKYFSEESKRRVLDMIDNISAVFKERVQELDWMGDSTKVRALEKLDKFNYKIGYPDKWKDYSTVDIKPNTLVENAMNVTYFNYLENMGKLGKPIDKETWRISPQTINAYYNSKENSIVFPAAILQPPFFNPDADDAINYGSIGAVIAHEFSHGFDDQGSKSDGDGNLKDWWTEKDRKRFKEKTSKLVHQFNQYEVIDGHHINGAYTLGENIADLGGVTLSYHALMKSYENRKKPEPIDGFDYKQRFFLGWAQMWHANYTDKEVIRRVKQDPHAHNRYRINGPLSNMVEFEEAFGCAEGNSMVLEDSARVTIW